MKSSDDRPIAATIASGENLTSEAHAEMYCSTCDCSYASNHRQCPVDGTTLARIATQSDLIGSVIDGRFTIQKRLGEGGMGTVYQALQHSVGRAVAIKVIHAQLAMDPHIAKRFLREAKLTSRLTHPHTITVLDSGQTPSGQLYMVMELLEGRTLEALMRAEGKIAPERAIAIATQVCDALDAAHRQDIMHRDLKPANIFMLASSDHREIVKILDFGLAKTLDGDSTALTHSNMLLGTPRYLPPEIALGTGADGRSDLYSLGVMLFELVSGFSPFDADNVHGLIYQHARAAPKALPDEVPADLRQIIERLLRKDPDERYATALELRAALHASERTLAATPRTPAAEPAQEVEPALLGMAATLHQEPRPAMGAAASPRRPWLWLLFASAALAGGLYVLLPSRDTPASASEASASATTTPAADAVTASAAPPDAGSGAKLDAMEPATDAFATTRSVRFETRPADARVSVVGVGTCQTPCTLQVDVHRNRLELEIKKRGFATHSESFDPRSSPLLEVALQRRARHDKPDIGDDEDFMTGP